MNKRFLQFLKAVEGRIERNNDKGHNMIHMYNVLYYAFKLNDNLENKIDEEVILTTVYLHDLFCYKDRKNHNVLAADFVRKSSFMKRYFDEETVEMIASAIYKHRTKFKDRKTDLEKILFDADKLDSMLDIYRMIERSIFYNIKNNPDGVDIFNDVYNHLKEKYGFSGLDLYYYNSDIDKEYSKIKQILNNRLAFTIYYNDVYKRIIENKVV